MRTGPTTGVIIRLAFAWLFVTATPGTAKSEPKRIHVFVALCDNATQAIAPVNDRIGNGDDPESNLYWGCSDGLPTQFTNSSEWQLVEKRKNVTKDILRRLVFRHKETATLLVAYAYRGSSIHLCLSHFLYAAAGQHPAPVQTRDLEGDLKSFQFGGASDLIAYIGHNGLMEKRITEPQVIDVKRKRDAIVLGCRSDQYFNDLLRRNGARPILTTQQLMYPASCVLLATLEGWLKEESLAQLRKRAGKAMANNQKISIKAATAIFTKLEDPPLPQSSD